MHGNAIFFVHLYSYRMNRQQPTDLAIESFNAKNITGGEKNANI